MSLNQRGSSPSDRIWFAQMLRAVAIGLVIFCHIVLGYWQCPKPHAVGDLPFWNHVVENNKIVNLLGAELGPLGVGLFFVISGFVIPLSLNKLKPGAFLIARFFRIYPTYACALFLVCLTLAVVSGHTQTNLTYYCGPPYWWSLSLVGEFFSHPPIEPVIWSLQIEIVFYFVCMLISSVSSLHHARTLLILAAGLTVAAIWVGYMNIYFWQPLQVEAAVSRFTTCISSLLIMFVGISFHNLFTGRWTLPRFFGFSTTCYILCMVVILSLRDHFASWIMAVAYSLALLIFAVAYTLRDSLKYNSDVNFLADISYPLYLVHAIAGFALLDWLHPHLYNSYLSLVELPPN
jgi:peptidoglycan/LPS O-acetylase OafA/YrhL